ncbi:MAG TPA: hypothetical protein VMX74_14745 [Pirellulales bacterium]|nr:hypothetical protein [Pirellulales bacterium]
MVLSANALITVAACKTYLGLSGSDDDTVLEMLVNSASQKAIQICGRPLVTLARTYYTNAPRAGCRSLQLRTWPVTTATTSIWQDRDNYAWADDTLVATTDYNIDLETGLVTLIDTGTTWEMAVNAIKVTFTAGYGTIAAADIPADLQQAVAMLVGWYMQRRASAGIKSARGGVVEIEYSGTLGPGGIPVEILGAFAPYIKRL